MVAWGAPPVNWERVGVALAEAEAALVASADEAADASDEAAEATAEDTAAAALEAADAAAELATGAALALGDGAAEGAALVSGMVMGTPTPLHVSSTAWMVVAWSAGEQAPWTQGWTVARREAPFSQWHLKSVRDEQPSEVRGPTKQVSYCHMSVRHKRGRVA